MRQHYMKMIFAAEKRLQHSLAVQVREGGENRGGFVDTNGMLDAKYAIYRVTSAIALYANEDSAYYHDEEVFRMILEGLEFVKRRQHENGLFDLITCNFFSAPDTAFCVKRMLPYMKFLQNTRDEKEKEIYEALYYIVKKGAYGIMQGGFHTPNHRWAIASQLLECGEFFDDEEMKKQADVYLMEGIDCNEDGEFAEKSAGNYNRINNDAMITIANVTGDDAFYDYAERNLRMMLTYIEPDGSIFTANSTRQDNGKLIYPKDYYMEYLELGIRRGIPEFLDMANFIFKLVDEKGITAPDQLIHYMNHAAWIDTEHDGMWKQPDFTKFYKDSGIARVHRGEYTYTVMSGKSGFLYYSNKSMHLELKIGGSFCEHRAFVAEEMQKSGEAEFLLHQTMKGWYYLPFKEKPDTSDWWKMDHTKREKKMGPDMDISVSIEQVENGIDVHIKTAGVEGAPFRVEASVIGAKRLSTKQIEMDVQAGSSIILKEGSAIFTNDMDHIEVDGGFGTHLFAAGLFGSEGRSPYAFTLYFTDYTPFEHVIKIR